MQRVQKQGSESENAQRTAQAKFTSKSREAEQANSIDDSPAMIAQRKKLNGLFGGAIQRVEDEEPLQGKLDSVQRVEEEEPLQGKFETTQRVEEEEPLQGKFEAVQRVEEEEPLQGKFEAASSTQLKEEVAKSNNTGLPENLKSGIESLSGMSMDNVKVHYNSSQPAQLNALAYAQGTDIHVAPGQEQHLPHEAWHVVQQAQGRVKPTMQMKEGVPVNDDAGLEREADVMGAKAAHATGERDGLSVTQVNGATAQMFAVPDNLVAIEKDVQDVANDIGSYDEDEKELPGGNIWADETRSATLRKLNEWEAYKLAYDETENGGDLPQFGEDVVTEPDVGVRDEDGDWTNVVENKFVSGNRTRITENVKDAIGQIKCSNRSPKYYGELAARIHLSDETREDLRANGSVGGDTKMKNAWESYLRKCTNRIVYKHRITLHVINLPDRGKGGALNYEYVLA